MHDERFSQWGYDGFLSRHHFSKSFAEAFAGAGHETILYKLAEDIAEARNVKKDGYTLRFFPVAFRIPSSAKFGNDFPSREFLNEVNAEDFDVVHFFSYYLNCFPYVLTTVLRGKISASYHGGKPTISHRILLPILQRRVHQFVTPIRHEVKTLIELGANPRKVSIIPEPCANAQETLNRPGDREDFSILYIGRIPRPHLDLAEEKSPFWLLLVMRELRRDATHVKLTVVGSGPGLNILRELISEYGLNDNVILVGERPHSEVSKFYSTHTITFGPIKLWDVDGTYGGFVQESLCCGTPVVAVKADRSIAERQRFGFLVDEDPQIAAREVLRILSMPDQLAEIGREAAVFVNTACSYPNVVRSWLDVLES
jgi:glycosyltransferase involved in cell wall biosynthesis